MRRTYQLEYYIEQKYIQTRPVGLVVMCEHWTPKGDCKVTGHKESQFYERNPFKKSSLSIPRKLFATKKNLP